MKPFWEKIQRPTPRTTSQRRATTPSFWRNIRWAVGCGGLLVGLTGCGDSGSADVSVEPPVRGLLTVTIDESKRTTRRRYPGVLEPKDITSLSFEVGGKLGEVALKVGQPVAKGDVLAQLDLEQFNIAIKNKKASVDEAQALLNQDLDDERRQDQLFRRGSGTKVALDQARTDVRASRARLRQAEEALKSAEEDLVDAVLRAPFDGIVNSVDADSFSTVSAGAAIASIYRATAYEVSFSVNFDIVSELSVGTRAKVVLADDREVVLDAAVTELGKRADTVSSFPVIVGIEGSHPSIRAGMAVQVAFEFAIPGADGYLIPLTAAIPEGQIPDGAGPRQISPLEVYVFEPGSGTVTRRTVQMAGIRDNQLLIIRGLEPGEKVAVAGVPFLRDGMKVKPIDADTFGKN